MSKVVRMFIAVPILAVSIVAQETAKTCGTSSLYGRVRSSDTKRPVGMLGTIFVTAFGQVNNYAWDQEEVQGESYCVKVPVTSKVFLHFHGDYIEPLDSIPVNTGMARRKHSWGMALAEVDPATQSASEVKNLDPQQKRQLIRAKLQKHLASLNLVGSKDLFIWHVELAKEVYRDDPDSRAEINQFISELKADSRYDFLKTSEYERKAELYSFIIARNQNRHTQSDVKPSEITALIDDSQVFPGIRANAISVLSTFDSMQNDVKDKAIAILTKSLENDPSVAVRVKAAEALGSMGAETALDVLKKTSEEDDSLDVRFAAKAAVERLPATPAVRKEPGSKEVRNQFFETANTQTVAPGKKMKVKGVVTRRDADSFIIQDANGVQTSVMLNERTQIKSQGGVMRGGTNYGVTDILRGLNLEVEGRGDGTNLVAEKVRFKEEDLRTARTVEANVMPVENRVGATEARIWEVEHNAVRLSGQLEELAAVSNAARGGAKEAQETADAALSAVQVANERISSLDDYTVQGFTSVHFRVGSAVLSAESKSKLDLLAQAALQTNGYMLEVKGFANSDGSAEANRRLSQRRADAVVRYLVENHNIPLQRIITPYGYGELQPVAENATHERREQHHYVEVNILASSANVIREATRKSSNTREEPSIRNEGSHSANEGFYKSWAVIEFPPLKEVNVGLTPSNTLSAAQGQATMMRRGNQTTIEINLSGLSSDTTELYLYAVDPSGRATLLSPIQISNGMASQFLNTPLDRFMLFLARDANVTAYGPNIAMAFRSSVPQGFAVLPLSPSRTSTGERVALPLPPSRTDIGERVAATTTAGANSAYTAPMLGIPSFSRGSDAEVEVKLAGALMGSRVNFSIEPRKDGITVVVARFHELKESPAGQVYVLWAVSPDNKYTKLGQIVNTGQRSEAGIEAGTTLPDFGLFITLEEGQSTASLPPSGAVVGTVLPASNTRRVATAAKAAPGFRITLGTIPSYGESNDGLKLDSVREGSPAEAAGLKAGDRLIKLAGRDIHNVYDYTQALSEMKAGQAYEVVVIRDGQQLTLKITPTINK